MASKRDIALVGTGVGTTAVGSHVYQNWDKYGPMLYDLGIDFLDGAKENFSRLAGETYKHLSTTVMPNLFKEVFYHAKSGIEGSLNLAYDIGEGIWKSISQAPNTHSQLGTIFTILGFGFLSWKYGRPQFYRWMNQFSEKKLMQLEEKSKEGGIFSKIKGLVKKPYQEQ